jgi:glycosyltransferase involved in cell wall biosynthesis
MDTHPALRSSSADRPTPAPTPVMARILQAIEQPHGGTAEHVLRLSTELAARGHEIEVVASLDSPVFDPLAGAGVPVHRIGFVGSIWAPGDDRRAISELGRLMRDGGFDVAHAHGMKAGALTRLAALRRRLPVVYSPHQFAFVANEFRPLRHPRIRRAVSVGAEQALGLITARLVCVSEFEYERAERAHVGRPRSRRVIYHGVDVDTAAEPDPELRAWAGEDLLFGSVSALRAEKGLHHLVDAAALLRPAPGRGVKVAIVGDGPERDPLVQRIESLGLGDRVRVFPFCGRVEPHLLALDGFVLPSHQFEVLSIGTIEAMACGLAVIASRVGGVPEVVANSDSGRLVPPGDPAAIASAIAELAADDGLRRRMGARGQEIASERFRMERMVDEIEALYLELVPDARA